MTGKIFLNIIDENLKKLPKKRKYEISKKSFLYKRKLKTTICTILFDKKYHYILHIYMEKKIGVTRLTFEKNAKNRLKLTIKQEKLIW